MRIDVTFVRGRLAGRTFVFPSEAEVVIGRIAGSDVEVPDDGVSRRHCVVRPGSPPTVEDLGSRNGTYVNGGRAEGRRSLAPGDQVSVGSASFRVTCTLPARSEPDRAPTGARSGDTVVLPNPFLARLPVCGMCGGTVVVRDPRPEVAYLCAPCRETLAAAKTTIGLYTVLASVGSGTSATVYRAMDGDGKLVALKVYFLRLNSQPHKIRRVLREAKLLARLVHDNIIRLREAGQAEEIIYVALEYVDGTDLDSELDRSGPFPPDRVAAIGRQVCAALTHAHGQGVVHRDLKPANLLLSMDGRVKVADFGLAKVVEEATTSGLTYAGTLVGTPLYMAPEQARSAKEADACADIYSLGATLFHLLTGRPPFDATSIEEILEMLDSDRPAPGAREIRPDVPAWLDAALGRALDKEPSRRFPCAEDFGRTLAAGPRLADAARPKPRSPRA